MKLLIFFLFYLLPSCLFAQQAYRVIYERKDMSVMPFSVNGQRRQFEINQLFHLVFNDSIAYRYITGKTRIRPLNIKADMHDYFHHSIIMFKTSGTVLHAVRHPYSRKRYFIRDTVTTCTWVIDTVIKKFMDWRCREAYSVSHAGDTLFALLAIDYPYPYAPFTHQSFPFLPLELYSERKGIHLVVKRIENIDCNLKIPADVPIITRKEWDDM